MYLSMQGLDSHPQNAMTVMTLIEDLKPKVIPESATETANPLSSRNQGER